MEQQGALLKRLAEADSEKAVTQRPLAELVGFRRQCAEGLEGHGSLALTFLWVLVSWSVKWADVPCLACSTAAARADGVSNHQSVTWISLFALWIKSHPKVDFLAQQFQFWESLPRKHAPKAGPWNPKFLDDVNGCQEQKQGVICGHTNRETAGRPAQKIHHVNSQDLLEYLRY